MEKGYTTELLLKRNKKNNENCGNNSLIKKDGEEHGGFKSLDNKDWC